MLVLLKMLRLGAAALAFAAAPAAAARYEVVTAGMVILPSEEPHAAGLERTVTPGDVLMRAPLGWADAALVEREVALEIAGIRDTIVPGVFLHRATRAEGGDLATLGSEARIYCGEMRVNAIGAAMGVATFGLTNIGSRVARQRRFCLVDGDADNRFERAFLQGTKRREDQHMVEIAPVPYTAEANRPMGPGNFVQVRYAAGGLIGTSQIFVDFYTGNIQQPLDALYTGAGRAPLRTRAATAFRTTPRPFVIADARFTVLSIDPESKAARIRYESDFATTPVFAGYRAQPIYVFVPSR
ncbi:MAG TPA: hypothetical protein VEC11_06640 [Allosphingosinicella sp.]|nr:hypothetical protein [Allosphingosinicella sp.]